jgi:hypothetical protein
MAVGYMAYGKISGVTVQVTAGAPSGVDSSGRGAGVTEVRSVSERDGRSADAVRMDQPLVVG